MNLNLDDILGFLKNYSSSVPMNQTASAGYSLANNAQNNQFALGNKSLDQNQSQFNDTLALQKMNDLWRQQFSDKQFGAGQQQQQFENSLTTKQANLYSDPTYQKFLMLTNPETIRGNQARDTFQFENETQRANKLDDERQRRIMLEGTRAPWDKLGASNMSSIRMF